jgi:transposase
VNVLKPHRRITVEMLLKGGATQREIERRTKVDRKTIRRIASEIESDIGSASPNSPTPATGSATPDPQTPPPRPPAFADEQAAAQPALAPWAATMPARATPSACEPHRAWIETQVQLGRNATSLYQELVDAHGFVHCYNSVKRFVATLRKREPERFDVLAFLPGEEAQVDYGQGALTLWKPGQYKRPYLFVMTLKYSGKSFRKVVWKTSQETWARLHEEAFHAFAGCPAYVVLDNLKEGVLRPDLYEPELNPVYAAMLAHYGVVADPCRVQDPNRKGTVESAIQHTQGTALKGKRFDTLEAQNAYLATWEDRWAATRIHGRKKRQVLEMYREEQPHLRPLPATRLRSFTQATRTVDDAGFVQVSAAYYAALPAAPGSAVTVRIYEHEIEILDAAGQVLRRHAIAARKGTFTMTESDRLFNPSRETARLLNKAACIGPHTATFAQHLFARLGRPGQRALYGLTNLVRTYPRADVEAVCARLGAAECFTYAAVKRALDRTRDAQVDAPRPPLTQSDPSIRPVADYQDFWNTHSQTLTSENA